MTRGVKFKEAPGCWSGTWEQLVRKGVLSMENVLQVAKTGGKGRRRPLFTLPNGKLAQVTLRGTKPGARWDVREERQTTSEPPPMIRAFDAAARQPSPSAVDVGSDMKLAYGAGQIGWSFSSEAFGLIAGDVLQPPSSCVFSRTYRQARAAGALAFRAAGEIRHKRVTSPEQPQDSAKLNRAIEDLTAARDAIASVLRELESLTAPKPKPANVDDDDDDDDD